MMQPNDTYTKMEAHFYNNGLMQTYSPSPKTTTPTQKQIHGEREREGFLETRGLNYIILSFSKK